MTSRRPSLDQTCILEMGEHSFVTKATTIAYGASRIATRAELQQALADGLIVNGEPLSAPLLRKVRELACLSPKTPLKCLKVAIKQGSGEWSSGVGPNFHRGPRNPVGLGANQGRLEVLGEVDWMKAFVLGLDGATWDVLGPLIEAGDLPNLARLRREGVSGTLNSIFPPLSPVAWTGVMTGKNSGKHGVFEFLEFAHDPMNGRVNSSRAIQAELVWEIAGRHGKTTVAGGVPMSYPPRPAPGFYLGDFPQPGRRGGFQQRPGDLEGAGNRARHALSSLVHGGPRRRQRGRGSGRAERLPRPPFEGCAIPDGSLPVGFVHVRPDGHRPRPARALARLGADPPGRERA